MTKEKIKVLYIAGSGRCGSTILENILGQYEGVCPVGEIINIWEGNLIEGHFCGCARPFEECEIWQEVFNEGFEGVEHVNTHDMIEFISNIARTRHLPLMKLSGNYKNELLSRYPKQIKTLETLYSAIQSTMDCKFIVDSSKSPTYLFILSLLDKIDLYVLHLVRDSRGVTYSRRKKKQRFDQSTTSYMKSFNPVHASAIWLTWNFAIHQFWKDSPKYMFLRYEDFIAKPKENVQGILDLLEVLPENSPFIEDNLVNLQPCHTTWGNPDRLKNGQVRLHADVEWKARMKKSDKFISTVITWPFLWKYRYLRSS